MGLQTIMVRLTQEGSNEHMITVSRSVVARVVCSLDKE